MSSWVTRWTEVLKLSVNRNEGTPLHGGRGDRGVGHANGAAGRGLHSSTFRLNVSALCGIGVHFGGLSGIFRWCPVGVRGYEGVFMVYSVSETAQVELKTGRV